MTDTTIVGTPVGSTPAKIGSADYPWANQSPTERHPPLAL